MDGYGSSSYDKGKMLGVDYSIQNKKTEGRHLHFAAFQPAGCEEGENQDEGTAGGRQEDCSEYPSEANGGGGPWSGGTEE